MAGPIDARVSPTKVNELAQEKPIEWFRANMIGTVPAKFEGAGGGSIRDFFSSAPS